MPSEALVVAEAASLDVLVRKRRLQNLELEHESMKKAKIDMEASLELAPVLLAERQRQIDELKRELKESGAIEAESDQQQEQQPLQQEVLMREAKHHETQDDEDEHNGMEFWE